MDELNEAPASVTYSVTSPKGYNFLFTMRDLEVSDLIKKMALMESEFESKGYTPQVKGWAPKATTPGLSTTTRMCQIHNIDMTQAVSRKTNKPYFSHNIINTDGTLGKCFGSSY